MTATPMIVNFQGVLYSSWGVAVQNTTFYHFTKTNKGNSVCSRLLNSPLQVRVDSTCHQVSS